MLLVWHRFGQKSRGVVPLSELAHELAIDSAEKEYNATEQHHEGGNHRKINNVHTVAGDRETSTRLIFNPHSCSLTRLQIDSVGFLSLDFSYQIVLNPS